MKLQKQIEKWQCAVTSFAMAMDMPVSELIEMIGHDGGEIMFPSKPDPQNRRGHNVYELIRFALSLDFAVTPIPLHPASKPFDNSTEVIGIFEDHSDWNFFTNQLATSQGTIECAGPRGNHMIAYDHNLIYDPRGVEFKYTRESCEAQFLYTYCLWRVDRI